MATRRYGRRLRRGAAGTAVAAVAMAALGASQAPGLLGVASGAPQDASAAASTTASDDGTPIDGGSPYVTQMPPLNTPTGPLAPSSGTTDTTVTVPGGGASLPTTVLSAYLRAQSSVAAGDPGCHLPWQLLAAIGQVESGQARGGAVDANGTTYQPILGPVLDGDGFADISDTDGGRYDGDPVHDRAVGPMQFIPSTWRTWGVDGNGDGVADPNNVFDAALAAAHYLCADGRDLAVAGDMDRAILGYNHSQAYLDLVRAWYEHFVKGGAVGVPDASGTPSPVIPKPKPSSSPSPSASASPSPSPTTSGTGSTSPSPTTSPTSPTSPTGTPSGSPTGTSTGTPTTSPTGGRPSGSPTTGEPSTGTTTPTTPPSTSPGCPADPTPTPTDSGTATPSPTASGTASPSPDPCSTDTTSPSPSDSPSDSPSAQASAQS